MFIDDVVIWIDGSPGSGKTTLIERVLEANRRKSIGAVRLRQNNKLRQPKEVKLGNEETCRYQNAGAEGTLLVEYPDNRRTSVADFFFSCGFRGGLFNAIYCEAELTDDDFPMDLDLFVLPPLVDPASIFEVQQIKADKDFMRSQFARTLGHLAPSAKKLSFSIEAKVEQFLESTSDKLEKLPPLTILKLTPGFKGLISASTILVNIRDEKERPAAEQLLNFIDEVGARPYQIENTNGYFWQPKKAMFIANLANPKDAELKKVVAKIKRKSIERWDCQ